MSLLVVALSAITQATERQCGEPPVHSPTQTPGWQNRPTVEPGMLCCARMLFAFLQPPSFSSFFSQLKPQPSSASQIPPVSEKWVALGCPSLLLPAVFPVLTSTPPAHHPQAALPPHPLALAH